jgi:hypothetical protein
MKTVDTFSLSLIVDNGHPPSLTGVPAFYMVRGTKLKDMGEAMINSVASADWDVLSLLDAGYAHSLLSLRHAMGEDMVQNHWLIIGLTG